MPVYRPDFGILAGGEKWFRMGPVMTGSTKTRETIFTASNADKSRLLVGSPASPEQSRERAESILRGIQNRAVADLFDHKDIALSRMPFRLVKKAPATAKQDPSPASPSPDSFIAVSYCWHNRDWASVRAWGRRFRPNKNPIPAVLLQAILEERTSDYEGIWIDQMCIDQADEAEKSMAIGAMDVIYQSARFVAVVLEDIVFDHDDRAALETLMEAVKGGGKWLHHRDLNVSFQLARTMWKIVSARWFTRAWCAHEYRVSNKHIFFIRCSTRSDRTPTVARLSAEFLLDLASHTEFMSTRAPGKPFAPLQAAYGRQFQRLLDSLSQRVRWSTELLTEWLSEWPVGRSSNQMDTSPMMSYMEVFRDIFSYDARFPVDKLSIVLNVLQSGLFFKGASMTEEQCCHAFYHIALAYRDPTALVLFGKRLQKAAWMRWPGLYDINVPQVGYKHRRLRHRPDFDDGALHLDLVSIGATQSLRRAAPPHLDWADLMIHQCAERADVGGSRFLAEISSDGPYGTSHQRRRFYAEILAILHECGIEWLVQSWKLKDGEFLDGEKEKSLRRAMDVNTSTLQTSGEVNVEDLRSIASLFMSFTAWMTEEVGMSCRPAWVQTDDSSPDYLLVLCPEEAEHLVVVPEMLLHADYSWLKRIWFLRPTADDGKLWTVIFKTCSFGTVDLETLKKTSEVMMSQRICS